MTTKYKGRVFSKTVRLVSVVPRRFSDPYELRDFAGKFTSEPDRQPDVRNFILHPDGIACPLSDHQRLIQSVLSLVDTENGTIYEAGIKLHVSINGARSQLRGTITKEQTLVVGAEDSEAGDA